MPPRQHPHCPTCPHLPAKTFGQRLADRHHPLWDVVKLVIVAVVAVAALHANYNGLDQRDLHTVIEIAAASFGVHVLPKLVGRGKSAATPCESEGSDDSIA